jgi:hypothetical protein
MRDLATLTVFCVVCRVKHVVNYRCAATRSAPDRIRMASPGIATALSENLPGDTTRQIRAVR